MHFPKPTFLSKRRVLEVVWLDAQIRLLARGAQASRDVIAAELAQGGTDLF